MVTMKHLNWLHSYIQTHMCENSLILIKVICMYIIIHRYKCGYAVIFPSVEQCKACDFVYAGRDNLQLWEINAESSVHVSNYNGMTNIIMPYIKVCERRGFLGSTHDTRLYTHNYIISNLFP